jgi:hypothetical protein
MDTLGLERTCQPIQSLLSLFPYHTPISLTWHPSLVSDPVWLTGLTAVSATMSAVVSTATAWACRPWALSALASQ